MCLRACTALLALSACTYSTNPPNLQGQDVHLTVLHTADVHSRVLPYNFTPNKFDQLDGLTPDLAPFGGAARMSSLLLRERAKASRVIHVDSGDCFQGAPIFNAFNGAVEMRAMSALGLDVAALGNHEFDKGPLNLGTQIQQWAGFPILAANYAFKDPTVIGDNILGALIKPYTILDADGLKVGVIGMGNVSAISQLVQGENSLGVIPLDTDQTIEYYAALIRPQVDVLVAVSHLGLDDDETTATTNQGMMAQTASQVRGDVDVVFGGHLHIVLNPPKQIPIFVNGRQTSRQTVLVHSGAFAKTFGRLDLDVHVNTPAEMAANYETEKAIAIAANDPIPDARRGYVKAYDYKLIPVTAREPVDGEWCVTPDEDSSGQACSTSPNASNGFCRSVKSDGTRIPCDLTVPTGPGSACSATGDQCLPCIYCHIPEDGKLLQIIEPYALAMNSSAQFQLTQTFANDTVPGGILRKNSNGGDSQLGNIVATAMRVQPEVQADFSMTNSLGIRADLSPGPIDIEEMYNVFPFDNSIEIIYLSGTEVQAMFDFIASKSASRGCQTQAQVSGVAVVMDCSVPPHLPNGASCDPSLYQGSENLGNCYEGAADLILIGSQRECVTDADCGGTGNTAEVCGASLGFCLNSTDLQTGSRAVCTIAGIDGGQPACGANEICVASHLNNCGRVLNPNGDYRVAVNDYVAAGGSGFTILQFNTAKINTYISIRDAVVDYLRRLDDPAFEGAYGCTGTPSQSTCHGAIRCDDPAFGLDSKGNVIDPYLHPLQAITPDVSFAYCPTAGTVGDCFGHEICILPHNNQIDGRIRPRFQ